MNVVKHHQYRLKLSMLSILFFAMLLIMTLILPINVDAQRDGRDTRVPTTTGRATLDISSSQATAYVAATDAANVSSDLEVTAHGVLTLAADTLSNPDTIGATAEYLGTQSVLDWDVLDATIAAISSDYESFTNGMVLTDDQLGLIDVLLSSGELIYNTDGSLAYTGVYSETAFNALVDSVLETAEYDPTLVNVDLIEGGFVISIMSATLPSGMMGNLLFFAALEAVDSEIVFDIVWASINGRDVPDSVLFELEAEIEEMMSSELNEVILTDIDDFDYTFDELIITETEMIFVVTLLLPEQ